MEPMEREKILVVDDSATDCLRMESALKAEAAQIITASTVSEAEDLMKRHKFSAFFLDYFLRGTTSRQLIIKARKRFPRVPIVVVSGQAGKDATIYKAGADEVIPKVRDLQTFRTIVQNALGHARSVRESRVTTTSTHALRMGKELSETFAAVVDGKGGNVLVISEPGMGRSEVARAIVDELFAICCTGDEEKKPRPKVVSFTCSPDDTFDSVDAALFGVDGGLPGLIANARNGVLLLEEAHLLPPEMQEKMKEFASRTRMRTNGGILIRTESIRVVFTALPETPDRVFVDKFCKSAVKFVIRLPSMEELSDDLRGLVEFLFERAAHGRIKPERGLIGQVVDKMRGNLQQVTLRSSANAIDSAIEIAAREGRDTVLVSDFGGFEGLFDQSVTGTPKEWRYLVIASDDRLGVGPWRKLYEVVRSGKMEQAEDLVKKMMVEYAMIRYRGNKTRIAAHLGVTRQYLYRACLRDVQLSGKSPLSGER